MTFRVEPFQPAHYVQAVPRGSTVYAYAVDPESEGLALAQGYAYSAFVDDRLAGCAGIVQVPWGGSARLWAVLTDVGRAHPIFMHRATCRHLLDLCDKHGINRVDVACVAAFGAAGDWIEAIGRYLIKRGWHADYLDLRTNQPRPLIARRAGPDGVDMLRWGYFRE